MANVNALSPGTILNAGSTTYKIIRVLGSGGFGITYLVETRIVVGNIEIPAQFAIKEHFISSLCERQDGTQHVTFSEPVGETVKNSRRAFIREAQRLQSLGIRHHNIVSINEVFEANNTAYYVMEYLEGETLQQYVARRGALSVDETLSLLRPVIDAVATLHKNNITHYDIKPANIIIVASEDGSPRPVLIDFGLSKHYDESGEGTSSLIPQGFTHGYAPVEQNDGLHKFSPQADVYALAATILYCITGRKPAQASEFDSDSLSTTLRDIAPVSLIGILQRGMAYSRQQRTPDANTLYDELYNGAPISVTGTVSTDGGDTRPFVLTDTHPIAQTAPISRNEPVRKSQPISEPEEDFEPEYTTERSSHSWIWIAVLALIIIGGVVLINILKNKKDNIYISDRSNYQSRMEAQRETEQLEAERLEYERLETERLKAEKLEAERQEQIRQDSIVRVNFSTPDLSFHDLHGHVKNCDFTTTEGEWDSTSTSFNEDGEWSNMPDWSDNWYDIGIYEYYCQLYPEIKTMPLFERDAKGYISVKHDLSDYEGLTTDKYIWKNGKIMAIETSSESGNRSYEYDDKGLLKKIKNESFGGEGYNYRLITDSYSDYKFDECNNWIQRKLSRTEYSIDGSQKSQENKNYIQKRNINYY